MNEGSVPGKGAVNTARIRTGHNRIHPTICATANPESCWDFQLRGSEWSITLMYGLLPDLQ